MKWLLAVVFLWVSLVFVIQKADPTATIPAPSEANDLSATEPHNNSVGGMIALSAGFFVFVAAAAWMVFAQSKKRVIAEPKLAGAELQDRGTGAGERSIES
jgi:hypothetical protein